MRGTLAIRCPPGPGPALAEAQGLHRAREAACLSPGTAAFRWQKKAGFVSWTPQLCHMPPAYPHLPSSWAPTHALRLGQED